MVTMRLGGFNLKSLQIPTPLNHRILRSNPDTVVIHLEVFNFFQINLLQVSLPQSPTSHRPLCCKMINLVIHLEMVAMRLGGFNLLQIPTPFNHRLLRSNSGLVGIHVDLLTMRLKTLQINLLLVSLLQIPSFFRSKMINPCTVVIHMKMITTRLGGPNPRHLHLLHSLHSLQISTSITHRLLRRGVIGVGVIIYLEEMRSLVKIHHQVTPKIN